MAHSSTKAQVRLDPDVEAYVADEQERIGNEERMEVSTVQVVNRMLREWRDTAVEKRQKPGKR